MLLVDNNTDICKQLGETSSKIKLLDRVIYIYHALMKLVYEYANKKAYFFNQARYQLLAMHSIGFLCRVVQ
jgi:hypothetical protein